MSERHEVVLLAEPESEGADRREAVLEASGFRLVRARDLAELLSLESSERPLLAIIDLFLPGPGLGLGAGRSLQRHRRTELFFLTPPSVAKDSLDAALALRPRGFFPADGDPACFRAAVQAELCMILAERSAAAEVDRFKAAVKSIPDLMILLDEDGTYIDILTSDESLLYKPSDEMRGRRIPEFFDPSQAEEFSSHVSAAARGERAKPYEYELRVQKGVRWFEGQASPIGRSEGGKALVVFLARDITARKRAEEEARRAVAEKDMLLRELKHRVKNNLAMMSSLFSLESARITRPEDRAIFENAQDRLRAMAFVYDRLYGSEGMTSLEMGSYIADLARDLHAAYEGRPGRISLALRADRVELELKRAVPLGLALAELINNAFKYGFPDGAEGRLVVSFSVEAETIRLMVEDDGVDLPADFSPSTAEGTGTRLIALLAKQIGGAFGWGRGEGGRGARFEFALPV